METKIVELSIMNCIDYIKDDVNQIEKHGYHGLAASRTKAEMQHDIDQMLVAIQDLKRRIGIY